MQRTKIDWPNLTHVWNPIVGCTNGCFYCYAARLNNRFKYIPEWNKPTYMPERILEPLKLKKPAHIFVGSMADIPCGPPMIVHNILDTIRQCPQHTFYFLTKHPSQYSYYQFPDNCHLGVSMSVLDDFNNIPWQMISASIDRMFLSMRLMKNRGNIIFLSLEPIMTGVKPGISLGIFDYVIVGAMTGPRAKEHAPQREWIDSIKHYNVWYKKSIIKVLANVEDIECFQNIQKTIFFTP